MHCSHKDVIQVSDKASMPLAAVFYREVINNQTPQQTRRYISIEVGALGCNDRAVCHARSRNRFSDFTKNCNFERYLIRHNIISPEQKLHQLRVHLS